MYRHTITWVILSAVIAMMFVQLPQMAAKQDAILHTYSALVEVDALAKQKFVEPFDDDRLVEGAIRGMMLQLDPYSGYIAPRELEAFERRTHGDFMGVGIEIGIVEGAPTIIAPIEGSPAAKAGVHPGDVILAVNGAEIKGRSVFDIEERLGGKPGTQVQLRVQRQGRKDPVELSIVRGPVMLGTVRGFRRDPAGSWDFRIDTDKRIAYIRISSFYDTTMRDFDAALRQVLEQGVDGLILDLRFNPGGVLHQAVAMVDRFLREGLILSTVTRRRAVQEYYAVRPDTIEDLPLVILINRFSASSSEIVAGSLQDHGRAWVVGERSFGKGSVQHLIHLTDRRAAVKLTVAYYRLPSGRILHRTAKNVHLDHWGVMPDVEIALSDERQRQLQESRRLLDSPPLSAASGTFLAPEFIGPNLSGATAPALPIDEQLAEGVAILRSRAVPLSTNRVSDRNISVQSNLTSDSHK